MPGTPGPGPVRWIRAEVEKPIEFRLMNQQDQLQLSPGNTWIELAEVSEDPNAEWRGIPVNVDFAE